MAGDGSEPRTLKTADVACRTIFALRELDGATLTELADHLDRSKSGVHHYLSTLIENQLVVKDGDEYHLSSRFLLFGEYVRQRSELYQVGREEIDNLAAETGEYAHLMHEENGLGIHLYKSQAKSGAAADFYRHKTTKPDYLHFSAAGKAILAHLPRERVEEIIDRHGLVGKTENTLTDRESLLDELELIRSREYALNDEEEVRGTRAVGAAVLDSEGTPIGGLSVSGPTTRIDDERFYEKLPKDIMRAANIIEITLNTQ
jgi:DNA-binding IclR family transcriptional regulator